MMQSLFRKKFNNFGYDVIDILLGFDRASDTMQVMLEALGNVLQGDYPGLLIQFNSVLLKFN